MAGRTAALSCVPSSMHAEREHVVQSVARLVRGYCWQVVPAVDEPVERWVAVAGMLAGADAGVRQ